MKTKLAMRGVTLIEMMIAITVVALLLGFGLPSYGTWIQNSQIRTGAEAIQNGLQLARNEAVRRNTTVRLALAGSGWSVDVVDAVGAVVINGNVQSRSAVDGSSNTAITTYAGAPPAANATAIRVTFNGLGRVVANGDGSPTATRIDVDSTVLATGDSRDLRIVVDTGGNVKMCDPDTNIAAGDPRKCA